MMHLLMLLLFNAHAESTVIFQCQITNVKFPATLQLDAVGSGKLIFTENSSKKSCPLKLRFLNDGQSNIVPEISATFLTKECKSQVGSSLKEELLPQIRLSILTSGKALETQIQWIQSEQPEKCKIEIFDKEKIRAGAEKRRRGNWGGKINPRD